MTSVNIIAPTDNEEGTTMKVQSWLIAPGDAVALNQPIVELETDKVTVEVEASADGVMSEILIEPGQDVEPGAVLGRINTGAGTSEEKSAVAAKADAPAAAPKSAPVLSEGQTRNTALSPSVRRLVAENSLDVSAIIGTGRRGRVTLQDARDFLASNGAAAGSVSPAQSVKPAKAAVATGETTRIQHTSMRRAIADHMQHSVQTAPHVTAVFEADFSAIAAHRAATKESFASKGVKLSYTAYIVAACVEAMKSVPEVNSQWHDDYLDVFGDVNIGVGTALGDKGLVVPVIHGAQTLDLFGIAKALQDNIDRARTNKLKPADVRGGTFTISNHGVSGSLVATPIIINQPQSAILGVGKLEKRVIVKTVDGQDVMAIRPMAYVSLTIDHRVLDGHQTNTWLSAFVAMLENWEA